MREYFYFLKLMRRELYGALLGIGLSFIASFASVALMGTATWFLSAMAIAGFYDFALNIFIPSALIRLLALMRTILRYLERYYTHDATFKLLAYLRVFLFERALELKLEEALKLRSADLQRRMQADVERLEMIYVRQVAPFICAVLMGLLVGGVLLAFSWLMTLTALCLMLIAGIIVPAVLTLLSFKEAQAQSSLAVELNSYSANLLRGFFDLVLLGTHGHIAAAFLERSQQLAKARSKIVFYEQMSQVFLLTCAELTLVLLLIEGAPLAVAGKMSYPQLMLLAVSAMAAFEVLVPLAAACLNLPYVVQAAQRVCELLKITEQNSELQSDDLKVFSVLESESEHNVNSLKTTDESGFNQSAHVFPTLSSAVTQSVASSAITSTVTKSSAITSSATVGSVSAVTKSSVAISSATSASSSSTTHSTALADLSFVQAKPETIVSVEHVSFAYALDDGTYLRVLQDCSLTFSSHRNYLLKSPSGSGKTTLVMLLTALLFPQSGQIKFNGQPYSSIKRASLRTHFAVAMQDITLFSGSIKEIFTQVRPKVTKDEILQVLDIVELKQIVMQLPEGMDTWIGAAGISLSGGQLRRLCTARALLMKEADFLILDEPGEGLDEIQEKRVIERIQNLRKGVIIITHKNAGAALSDEIIHLKRCMDS